MKTSTCERILLVDDDQALLDSFRRNHRKAFNIHTACGGEQGLEILHRDGPFAVVVSDYQMPGMNGIAFLASVSEVAPDCVRIMLTGNADLQSAIDAVNEGQVFRFLTKPCAHEAFAMCLRAALEQYRLKQAERTLLEHTVRGSIEVLADVLALSNPDAFGRSIRAQGYVRQIVAQLELKHSWQYETAALLSQIGLVAMPSDIIERLAAGEQLPSEYDQVIERHPTIAQDLLSKIPHLEYITEMIANQRLHHDEARNSPLNKSISLGSQILAAALDFDELLSLGSDRNEALHAMAKRSGHYSPRLLKVLAGVELPGQHAVARSLPVQELRVGMLLDQDVRGTNGALIVASGNAISQGMLARLRNYAELGGITGLIRARVTEAKSGGHEPLVV
jgi:response regulator RpfG family c-di-GMP phosphodiesterase